jgi:hypothetical protein
MASSISEFAFPIFQANALLHCHTWREVEVLKVTEKGGNSRARGPLEDQERSEARQKFIQGDKGSVIEKGTEGGGRLVWQYRGN